MNHDSVKHWLRKTIAIGSASAVLVGSQPLFLGAALAATSATSNQSDHSNPDGKVQKPYHRSHNLSKTRLGLDQTTLKLVNSGKWQEATSRLEVSAAGNNQADRTKGWLAFAYLFNNDCAKLDDLSQRLSLPVAKTSANPVASDNEKASTDAKYQVKVLAETKTAKTDKDVEDAKTLAGTKDASGDKVVNTGKDKGQAVATPTADDNPYALVIEAFDQACHGRAAEANSTLQRLPARLGADPLCNFALAVVSGKQGLAGEAAAYVQRTVDLEPDFGWGYRTMGFLQQRWLKQPKQAEDSYLKALSIAPNLQEATDAIIELRLSRNDYDGAIDMAKQSLKKSSPNPLNNYRLSQIYIQQWRLREAQAELTDAIKRAPENAKFYRARASVKRLRGDINGAIVDQQKAYELGQDKPFELTELAELNMQAGNNNRAADNLAEALKLDPNNQSAHSKLVVLLQQEKRYSDLVDEYKRALAKKPKDARLHLDLGIAYMSSGKLPEAKAEFVESQNLDQSDPEPHRQMGALYLKEKNFEKAAKEYTAALNINPSSVQDLAALGYCYAENGDFMQAEAAYVTALALQQLLTQTNATDRVEVMRSLANLLLEEGRYSDAAGQFEAVLLISKKGGAQNLDTFMLAQAKTLRDRDLPAANQLIDSFNQLNESQRQEHLPDVIDVLLNAHRPELARQLIDQDKAVIDKMDEQLKAKRYVQLSRLERIKGNPTAAIDWANKAIGLPAISPRAKSDALVALAEAQLDKGDLDAAGKSAEKASDTYAKSAAAYVVSGKLSLTRGEPDLAIGQAKKALELNPYDAKAYLVLGEAETRAGKTKEAMASYRKAAELYPSFLEAHKLLLDSLRKLSLTEEANKEAEQVAQMEKQQ